MAKLFLYLDESWPSSGDGLSWVLADDRKSEHKRGIAVTPADLPKSNGCELVTPASLSLLLDVQAPQSNMRRFLKALPNAVEDRVAVDAEDLHVTAGSKTPEGKLPLVVTDKRWLIEVLAELAQWGLKPVGIRVETLLAPLENDSWTVVWKGDEGYARTGKLAGVSLAQTTGGEPPAALISLVSEAKEEQKLPANIFVYTQTDTNPPDLWGWSDKLGVQLQSRGHFSWDDGINKETMNTINLLQGDLAPGHKLKDQTLRLKFAVVLVFAIAIVFCATYVAEWVLLTRESERLNSEINKSFVTAFPKAKSIVDPPLQMRRNLEDMRWRAGETRDSGALALMAEMFDITPESAFVDKISYDRNKLTVALKGLNAQTVATMRGELKKRGLSVSVDSPEDDDSGSLTAITVERKNR